MRSLTYLILTLPAVALANPNPFTNQVKLPEPKVVYQTVTQPVAQPANIAPPPLKEVEDTKTVIPEQKTDMVSLVGFSGKKAMLKVVVGAMTAVAAQEVKFIGSGKMVMVSHGQNLYISGRNFKVNIMSDGVKLTRPNMSDEIYLYPDAMPVALMSETVREVKSGLVGKANKLESSGQAAISTGGK